MVLGALGLQLKSPTSLNLSQVLTQRHSMTLH